MPLKHDGYLVAVRNKSTGEITIAGETTSESFTVKGLDSATEYSIYVRTFTNNSNGTRSWGSYSEPVSIQTLMSPPQNLRYTSKSSSQITLKWDKVSGASYYEIYEKTSSGYKVVATTTSTKYTLKNLSANSTHTYCVTANKTLESGVLAGSASAMLTVTTNK